MKYRKFVAWGMLVTLGLVLMAAFDGLSEGAEYVAGLGLWTFGIWSSVLLLKVKEIKHED